MVNALEQVEKKGLLKSLNYPESTNPIMIRIREYVTKCVSGDIDTITHGQIMNGNHESKNIALAAEDFFKEQLM